MEHEIVRSVAAAQKDAQAADALVRQYLPFIKAETAKFLKRIPVEGQDDELELPCLPSMRRRWRIKAAEVLS